MSDQADPLRVAVVGAGIVGLATALHLRRGGARVTVVHADPVDDSASCGNAGAIAIGDILPITGVGVWTKVPGWLMDPLGPLYIRWGHLPRLLPWLLRFLRAGTPTEIDRATRATAALMKTAIADYEDLLAEVGLGHLLVRRGVLWVYRNEAARAASGSDWAVRAANGIPFEPVDRAQIERREPALGPAAHCGYVLLEWSHFLDPGALVGGIADYLRAAQVAFRAVRATDIVVDGGRATALRTTDGGTVPFDALVIAAGAWSNALAGQLGDRVPLESERGYNTTLPDPGVPLNNMVDCPQDHFVMTPMSMGLRIGGGAEFAGLSAPPNYARSDALVRLAKRYLPDLDATGGSRWMGHRPVTPDNLPVIGRASGHANVYYAFGHGHLGLTEGATTGRLVAALALGRDPGLNLTPYRVERFR